MAKKMAGKKMAKKSSSVIKPGTGSGIGVKAGSTSTKMSAPKDSHGLDGRKHANALK